jgi:hypothetical protein
VDVNVNVNVFSVKCTLSRNDFSFCSAKVKKARTIMYLQYAYSVGSRGYLLNPLQD